MSYILQETGGRIILEDGSGFILLEADFGNLQHGGSGEVRGRTLGFSPKAAAPHSKGFGIQGKGVTISEKRIN